MARARSRSELARSGLFVCLGALYCMFGCNLSSNGPAPSPSPTPSPGFSYAGVLSQHNDNSRTGQYLGETTLTPANVNVRQFGKLFSVQVDGYVYAQPLYVADVPVAGATHNVLYVATEGDSVYAFDADTGAPLWRASLLDSAHGATPGETTVNILADLDSQCSNVVPQVGVTGTPVIDSASGTIYVEAKSKRADGRYVHRLHKLDITTGAEMSPGPAVIKAQARGAFDGGGVVTFNDLYEFNRAGLLLQNGQVFIGYGSHCDDLPFHGWLLAYNAAKLTQTAAFLATPDGVAGGIWMAGAGIAADSTGNVFIATGNGKFDGGANLGDTVLKLVLLGNTLAKADFFTPFDQANDDVQDFDVGGGGILLLPDQPGTHPHEMLAEAKNGSVYLIDRDQMTANNHHYCSGCTSNTNIVQEFSVSSTDSPLISSAAYWNGTVYITGTAQPLRAFSLGADGKINTTPASSTAATFGFPGSTPSVSANGTTNGIVWTIDSSQHGIPMGVAGPAVLHAYDATNLANELWNSSQAANGRDLAGSAVKFTVPTIANGKVYIGTQTEVDVYGLLP